MSKLILCGGTGVHVGLAYLRLHLVSKFLGNYENELPEIIVVDRDSGTAEDTALKALNSLCANWPEQLIAPKILNPTPQGQKYKNATQINKCFQTSPLANAMFSDRQLEKDFSLGMLCSPALGAAVFELKTGERDREPPYDSTDAAWRLLQKSDKTKVAIAASLVGGTGASVAPTITKLMAENGHQVCISPLHRFFQFNEWAGDDEKKSLAQLRNREMAENAHSATAYFGEELAGVAALIPIGVKFKETREYTDNNSQPPNESAAHLLAASTFIQHFNKPISPGLYALSGNKNKESAAELTDAFLINGVTLQLLANRTAALAVMLKSVANMSTPSQSIFGSYVPSVLSSYLSDLDVRKKLHNLAALFQQQVTWFNSLKIMTKTDVTFFTERNVKQRLSTYKINIVDDAHKMAFNVFTWLAQWVSVPSSQFEQHATDVTTFWPDCITSNVGGSAGAYPGSVAKSADGSLTATLDIARLTANGWPASNAAESFFKYCLEKGDKTAQRQLEIMLAGLVNSSINIEKNIDENIELRALFGNYPEYILIYKDRQIGFTSCNTLSGC